MAPGVWCCWPPPPGGPLGVTIHTVLRASSAKNRCIWENGGRCSGSRLQHRSISSYRPRGQAGGRDRYTYIVAAVRTEGREQMFFSSQETGSALPAPSPLLPAPSALTCRPWSRKNSPAFSMTCSSVSCPKGWVRQSISTSHRVTPKAHTSLAVVNFPWSVDKATGGERHQATQTSSSPHRATDPPHFPGPTPLFPVGSLPISLSLPPSALPSFSGSSPLPHLFPFLPSCPPFSDPV